MRAESRARGERVPAYRAIDVSNDDDGSPRLTVRGRPELSCRLNISISHTDGAAIAAVADTRASGTVGVDIEVTKPLSPALVHRVLRASEIARLDTASHPHPSPLDLWTAKEAAMKAAHGTCTAMRDLELDWTDGGNMNARVVGPAASTHVIVVRHRVVGPYTIAVALCR